MARMLEALKQSVKKNGRIEAESATPRVHRPEADVPAETPAEEEVPYIEVGGRNRTVEASASVMASGPLPVSRPALSLTPYLVDKALPIASPPATPATLPAPVLLRPRTEDPNPLSPAPERISPDLVVFHRPRDPVSEPYRSLLSGICMQLPANRSQAICFTAWTPGAGVTTVLLNLAIALAQEGKQCVCVVDANQRRPALAERLGLRVTPGLGDVLAGVTPLATALQATGQSNLQALTVGRHHASTGVRLVGEAFRSLLGQLRERFDRILVDAACWDGRPEMVALGSACDAVYLVLRQAEEDAVEVKEVLRVLPQQGARLQGCILTQR